MFLEGQLNWLEASEKARGIIGVWKAKICLGWQLGKRAAVQVRRKRRHFLESERKGQRNC